MNLLVSLQARVGDALVGLLLIGVLASATVVNFTILGPVMNDYNLALHCSLLQVLHPLDEDHHETLHPSHDVLHSLDVHPSQGIPLHTTSVYRTLDIF